MSGGKGWRRAAWLLLAPLACASGPPGEAPPLGSPEAAQAELAASAGELDSAATQPVPVLFPAGACRSGRLEVQVWQRRAASGRWRAHPRHPTIRTGSCHFEDPALLLNEIRVRCVDPRGQRVPSNWVVGADITPRDPTRRCPDPTPHPNAIR